MIDEIGGKRDGRWKLPVDSCHFSLKLDAFAKNLRADVAELVDAPDLKSVGYCNRGGSSPPVGNVDFQ